MPSGTGHQLVTTHEFQNHCVEQQHQSCSFMEDPSLFSTSNPQQQHMFPHQFSQHQHQFHDHLPFCSLNFKLGLNENSSSTVHGGLSNLVLRHDVPEARPSSLLLPNSWHAQQLSHEPIKEPFWCNEVGEDENGSKCYKYCPQAQEEEETHNNEISLEEKYRLFGELEAIYSLPNAPAVADQAGSGSALTGEITNNVGATTTSVPAAANVDPINGVDHGSETSIGGEKAARPRKKKKKMKEQLGFVVGFFECLVKQVMDHQEGLHKRFLEAIERMDKGRAEREEAWRRQEAEKQNREVLSRAQYQAMASSREAQVVQYIEKITGQSVELPARNTAPQLSTAEIVDSNSRWPKAEVEALIGARVRLEHKFQEPGLKGPLWEEVSSAMASMGFQRSAKRCKEKWENINKYFRKKKDSANANSKPKKKKSSQPSKTCSYFDQLDQLYSRTNLGLNTDDPLPGLDEAQQRGGYSELLAYIVDQNEPSISVCEANLDEKVEGRG